MADKGNTLHFWQPTGVYYKWLAPLSCFWRRQNNNSSFSDERELKEDELAARNKLPIFVIHCPSHIFAYKKSLKDFTICCDITEACRGLWFSNNAALPYFAVTFIQQRHPLAWAADRLILSSGYHQAQIVAILNILCILRILRTLQAGISTVSHQVSYTWW